MVGNSVAARGSGGRPAGGNMRLRAGAAGGRGGGRRCAPSRRRVASGRRCVVEGRQERAGRARGVVNEKNKERGVSVKMVKVRGTDLFDGWGRMV